jgi:tRNA pseudouridine38-40 synthase
MPTFKITLAYDGAGFVGWQRQASGTSIQGLLEDALRELDGRDVAVAGAGRTDAGVHALGQAAGFTLAREIEPEAVVRAMNARLPESVRVLAAALAPADFHARFGARAKTYRYRVWNDEVLSPFERDYVWHVPGTLDVESMAAAARLVEGRHDFSAFHAVGGATRTTERVVASSRIARVDARLIVFEISGSGFLRYMVRIITGTLVEIGRGRRSPEWLREVLASRDRAQAGPTAPAAGLFLVSVDYDADALAGGP